MMQNKKTIKKIHSSEKRVRAISAALIVLLALGIFSFAKIERVHADPQGGEEEIPESAAGVQDGAFEVTGYRYRAEVGKDHSYDVEEKISVNIPDQLSSIEFSIPSGNFRISDIMVEEAAYEAKKASEASTVSIVDTNKLTAGRHEYTIRYRIREYRDRDDSKDIFYCNVLLPEWKQPIGEVDILVTFPEDFPWDDMQCYAGQFGVQDTNNKITFTADEAAKTVSVTGRMIPENFGITLKAQLPDGYWTGALDGSWALNAIVAGLGAVVLLLLIMWVIGGRDLKVKRPVVTKPLGDMKPVELGYVFNGKVDIRDVVHMLLYFADKGYLRISEYQPKRYRLFKMEEPVREEKMYRSAYHILFEDIYKGRALEMEDLGPRLDLIMRSIADDVAAGFTSDESAAYTPLSRAFRYIGAVLSGIALGASTGLSYSYVYLQPNILESIAAGAVYTLALLLLCREIDGRDSSSFSTGGMAELLSALLAVSDLLYAAHRVYANTDMIVMPLMVIALSAAAAFLVIIMRARGLANAELVASIRGLRNFIYHPTPKELLENYLEDHNYYYDMLIYALAFGAEESWAISFLTLDVSPPAWYSDDIEGHAFSNLKVRRETTDYARDLRSFVRTITNAFEDMQRREGRRR